MFLAVSLHQQPTGSAPYGDRVHRKGDSVYISVLTDTTAPKGWQNGAYKGHWLLRPRGSNKMAIGVVTQDYGAD